MAEERFPLADLIGELGRQVREAQRRATSDGRADILKLKQCSVELGMSWEKKGEGGIEFWVVKLGGGLTKQNTQTISLVLEPVDETPLALTE